jgi:arabinogalactan oligomer/maltooligosaccharide transport system substrate-binding protein
MKRLIPLVLAVAIVLAAFGTGSVRAQDKKKITLWHGWQGAYAENIQKAFDEYNTASTTVEVELSNPGDLNKSLEVAIPAGEGPDIISWANDVIGNNVLAGNIVPLNDYGVTADWLASTFEPAAVTGVTYAGQIWALPEAMEGVALFCNAAVIKRDQLPTDAKDFAGLLKAAQDFQAANPGKYLVYNQGLGGNDAYHAAPVWHGFGANYIDETGKVGFDTPEATKAAEWLVEFSKVSPKEASGQTGLAAVTAGNAGCMWTGPWSIADFNKSGIEYYIVPMGSPFVGIKVVMLTINAEERGNAEAAAEVMKWFTSADTQSKLAKANGTIPASSEALKSVAEDKNVVAFGEQFKVGVPFPNTPYMGCLWGPAGDATLSIWTATQAPAEALKAAQDAASKCVEDKRPQVEALNATPEATASK